VATAVPTVTTRRLIAGLAASGALLAGLLIPLAPAHAHAAAPHRNGVQDDYSSDFYYDPGSPCDASICDSTAYSPNTDYYYDPGSLCTLCEKQAMTLPICSTSSTARHGRSCWLQ